MGSFGFSFCRSLLFWFRDDWMAAFSTGSELGNICAVEKHFWPQRVNACHFCADAGQSEQHKVRLLKGMLFSHVAKI